MKQTYGKDSQPAGILRRYSTGASQDSAAASLNQSAHQIDSEHDAEDRMSNNNSFHGDVTISINSHGSDSAPVEIIDPNKLADRLINFKQKVAASKAGNNIGRQSHNMRRHHPPPPPPPRPSSSGKQRNEEVKIPPPPQERRHSSDGSWCDATEEDYVRRMARIKLEQNDCTARGNSSSEYSAELQNRVSTSTSKNPQSPPTSAKDDELIDESPISFNTSSTSVNSNSFIPRPVRVSQFEDISTPSPPSKPKTAMASSLSTKLASATKNIASRSTSSVSSAPHSVVVLSIPKNCDKRGRCIHHPPHKVYRKKLLGGYEFISNCPVCVATSSYNPKLLRRNTYGNASEKSPSAKVSPGRNSRSRERARSKSADLVTTAPNLEENGDGNDGDTSDRPDVSSRMRRRTNSVERDRARSGREIQRRTRSRSQRRRSSSRHRSNSRDERRLSDKERSMDNKNMLEKALGSLDQRVRGVSRENRSSSRAERRSSDKERSMDNKNSLEKALGSLDQRVRGTSREKPPKMSASYDETANRKKSNLGSNPFVRQSDDVNFDKKTGRCKKHPSVVLAKKSAFRSNSWEMIRKNGCPLCSGAKVSSDFEVGQGFDEESKKNMERSRETPSLNLIDSLPPEMLRGRKVSKLRYTTPLGESGWYTGEVDSEGNPHGSGRMRFKTGHSYEGEWNHGYSEVHIGNMNRMKSGFGSNKAAWKQSEIAPSVRNRKAATATTPDAAAPIIPPGATYQYQHNSQHQGYSPAQVQSAQMQQWTNMSPQDRQMAMTQWYANNGMSPQPGYYPTM